jgi:hydroxypyruvate isomerase
VPFAAATAVGAAGTGRIVQKGRLKQSVCRWCYQAIPLPDFCKAVSAIGLTAIDLVEEKDWPLLADHGLVCSWAGRRAATSPTASTTRRTTT